MFIMREIALTGLEIKKKIFRCLFANKWEKVVQCSKMQNFSLKSPT